MANIKINEANRTLEVTKAFYKKASNFGSDEYYTLKEARNDFPTFKVVTKSAGKKNGTFKGLTITYMKEYMEKHDSEYFKDFCILCGRNENWDIVDLARMVTYGELKSWFLKKHPEFNEYTKNANKILQSA